MARYKDSRAKEIIDLGNHLFTKKAPLNSLHQEIAWQFCPDLAEFTSPHTLGEDWGSDRMDGFPEQASRELTNQLGAMLRPSGNPWFKPSTGDDEADADEANAQFLEYMGRTVRRELYKLKTNFVAATKEADRFYVNFGQAVISVEEAPLTRDHLFFRNHHIKDCAWLDNQLGIVDHLHRKQVMSARALVRMFGKDKLHEVIVRAAQKEPNREFEIRFVTMPTDEYEDFTAPETKKVSRPNAKKLPFTLCVIDVENCCTVKEGGLVTFNYVVPRWQRMTGSQYAFSPATMPALADARMAQMLAQILLESGEKAIDPPMIGKQDIVVGSPSLAAGGISWVDVEHDSALKDALDIVKIDADMRVGFQMRMDLREMLSKAFFLDKLNLPDSGAKEMTAFEVARRLEEHVRNLLPIFEPVQVQYNGAMLDIVHELLVNMKKIDFKRMPDAMEGIDTSWQFITPIQQAESRLLVEAFMETANVLSVGQQLGQTTPPVHTDKMLRDAVRGVGGPATWRLTQAEIDAVTEQTEQAADAQDMVGQVGQGAAVAEQVGKAGQALTLLQPPGRAAPQGDGQAAAPAAQGNAQGGNTPQAGAPAGIDLSAVLGALGQAGGQAAGQDGTETQSPEEPDMASDDDIKELRMMIRRLTMEVASIKEMVSKPKKIVIQRDKSGKISGATAGSGSRASTPEQQGAY